MAGRFEAVAIIQQGFDNWDISQRDPTIRSEQNLFGGRFVGRNLSGFQNPRKTEVLGGLFLRHINV
jgi:hypothetical protein